MKDGGYFVRAIARTKSSGGVQDRTEMGVVCMIHHG